MGGQISTEGKKFPGVGVGVGVGGWGRFRGGGTCPGGWGQISGEWRVGADFLISKIG